MSTANRMLSKQGTRRSTPNLEALKVRQVQHLAQRPSEDVTGVIDLRRQTVQLHVVVTSEMRFRVGCEGDRCLIDETRTGTATTDIRGGSAPVTVSGRTGGR